MKMRAVEVPHHLLLVPILSNQHLRIVFKHDLSAFADANNTEITTANLRNTHLSCE